MFRVTGEVKYGNMRVPTTGVVRASSSATAAESTPHKKKIYRVRTFVIKKKHEGVSPEVWVVLVADISLYTRAKVIIHVQK